MRTFLICVGIALVVIAWVHIQTWIESCRERCPKCGKNTFIVIERYRSERTRSLGTIRHRRIDGYCGSCKHEISERSAVTAR